MSVVNELDFERTSRMSTTGDVRLHYHDVGDGPPAVLLHGGGPGASAWSNWKRNVPRLARAFRLLLVDQPGYGRSDKPQIQGGMFRFYATAVRGLLDELGIERAHLVGNSLGGGTAVALALDAPERVDRLVLMGPAGAMVPITSSWPSEGLRALQAFYAPPGPSREKMQAIIDVLAFDSSKVGPELLEERYQAAIDPEAMATATAVFRAVQSGEETMVAEELWREVDRVPHPTLLMWGRDDRVVPLDAALLTARRMPDARLYVFPRCGHWAQVEHAEEFDELVTWFLTRA